MNRDNERILRRVGIWIPCSRLLGVAGEFVTDNDIGFGHVRNTDRVVEVLVESIAKYFRGQ